MRQRLSIYLNKFSSSILPILFGLVLLESFTRLIPDTLESRYPPEKSPMTMFSSRLGWILKPNYTGKLSLNRKTDSITYFINERGFRKESNPNKKQNVNHVIVIGGGSIFGVGLHEKDTLSQLLNKKFINKLEIETHFINLGVPGYSFDQELILLQDVVSKYKPQLIILALSTDTIFTITSPLHRAIKKNTITDYTKPVFQSVPITTKTPTGLKLTPAKQISDSLLLKQMQSSQKNNSFIELVSRHVSFVRHLRYDLKDLNFDEHFGDKEIYPEYQKNVPSWALLRTLIKNAYYLSNHNNSELMLLLVPAKNTFKTSNILPTAQNSLNDFCVAKRLTCVDLYPEFKNKGLSVYQKKNDYLNKEGLEIAANMITNNAPNIIRTNRPEHTAKDLEEQKQELLNMLN